MEPKSVGNWIRVSTADQARGESPEHHEKRARHYAESKDWDIKEVYHLEAVSGKSVMGHPEAQRMLNDIKTSHITGLIFPSWHGWPAIQENYWSLPTYSAISVLYIISVSGITYFTFGM